jgi:hypothetical protein
MNDWTVAYRVIGTDQRDARQRITLDRRITNHLSLGIEANPFTGEIQPRGSWFVTSEREGLPSVTLGAAADRLSTAEGHAVFLTFSKSAEGFPLQAFVSLKYGTADERLAFPFGGNLRLDPETTLQAIHDGNHTHVLLSRRLEGASVSLVWARTRYLGLQLGVGF